MLPQHIGFIMDGNGRWATARSKPRTDGYAEGVKALKRVSEHCNKLGIKAISVYAFSTENWSRPKKEIDAIFKLFDKVKDYATKDVKVTFMGDIDGLSEELQNTMDSIEKRTANNKGLILNVAVNYGGRADIVNAAKKAYDRGEFVEDTFAKHLSSSHLPPLDLVVRTAGEMRLSGFMLYEAAYAELLFLEKCWPDMQKEDVDFIVKEFEKRKRKFGA